jgi:hypothetical protein
MPIGKKQSLYDLEYNDINKLVCGLIKKKKDFLKSNVMWGSVLSTWGPGKLANFVGAKSQKSIKRGTPGSTNGGRCSPEFHTLKDCMANTTGSWNKKDKPFADPENLIKNIDVHEKLDKNYVSSPPQGEKIEN